MKLLPSGDEPDFVFWSFLVNKAQSAYSHLLIYSICIDTNLFSQGSNVTTDFRQGSTSSENQTSGQYPNVTDRLPDFPVDGT
jgi:hypothetical protein